MSAFEIVNFVIAIDDHGLTAVTPSLVNANISYSQEISSNIQTLSSKDAGSSDTLQGFLYVPDLDSGDPCVNTTLPYIPTNATRQANLPSKDYNLVALAPWVSQECTVSFLKSARYDPIRAFIFYLPDNGTDTPPSVDSEAWDLDDGGQWKSSAQYPVYAVPGSIGSHMMSELSLYSGNVTSVPNGQTLSELGIDADAYVRIYTKIGVSSPSSLPGLWVFVLISFAVLAFLLACTSYFVHLLQRRRRNALRRRVMAGEVNLEALGIKRLTVPKEKIDEIPLFIYACGGQGVPTNTKAIPRSSVGPDDLPKSPRTDSQGCEVESSGDQHDGNHSSQVSTLEASQGSGLDPQIVTSDSRPSTSIFHEYEPEAQPTCPICLDDFESHITLIRELYCGHIFHPECIDTFLSENSSLCPMCKTSALPVGYCPDRITNAMVRRERAIRRLRSQLIVDDDGPEGSHRNWRLSRSRVFPWRPRNRQVPGIEMSLRSSEPARSIIQRNSHLSREEIARIRAQELFDLPPGAHDLEFVEDQRPKWRQVVAGVFPGFD